MQKETGAYSCPRPASRSWNHWVFLLLASLLLISFLATQKYYDSFLYAVMVEGEEVGLVEKEELLDDYLLEVREEAQEQHGIKLVQLEGVQVEKQFRPWEEEDPRRVKEAFRELLTFKANAYMITVDGKPKMPVATEEDARGVVAELEQAFASGEEDAKLVEVFLNERVSWKEKLVNPEEIEDPAYVTTMLLRGTDREEVYLVSRGDTLWDIARRNEISLDELYEANPHIKEEIIRPGEELELIVSEPVVNVTTVKEITEIKEIPYETTFTTDSSMWRNQTRVETPGEKGEKKVTYRVTMENNKEVGREKLAEEVVREPREEVVVRGTGNVPSRGTGRFGWPVQGGGMITQNYHSRHRAIDISVAGSASEKMNTPILAADDGIVVHAGQEGSYGLSVVIYHGGARDYYTRYAHNSRNLVSAGDEVKKGQVIAYMGNTGRTRGATGIHVHFEIRTGGKYGTPLNPLDYFQP